MGRLVLTIFLTSSLAVGMPLGKSSRVRPGGSVRICDLLYLTLGMALAGGGLAAFNYFHKSSLPEVAKGVESVDDVPVTEPDRELFDKDSTETAFELKMPDGTVPSLTIFKKNGFQRTIAHMFHQHLASQTEDPAVKKKWQEAPPGIQVSLEGVRFQKSEEDPTRVKIFVKSDGREMELPKTIPLAELQDGKPVSLDMPEQTHEIQGVGKAVVSGSVKLQYLKDKGSLFVQEAAFKLDATVFGKQTDDPGKFTGLVGTRK